MEYIVSIKETDALGQTIIKQRTVVYVDSELQAKVAGAELLGVDQSRVTVTNMSGAAVNPNVFNNAKAPDLPNS
jgi:hypothetical protein